MHETLPGETRGSDTQTCTMEVSYVQKDLPACVKSCDCTTAERNTLLYTRSLVSLIVCKKSATTLLQRGSKQKGKSEDENNHKCTFFKQKRYYHVLCALTMGNSHHHAQTYARLLTLITVRRRGKICGKNCMACACYKYTYSSKGGRKRQGGREEGRETDRQIPKQRRDNMTQKPLPHHYTRSKAIIQGRM